VVDLIEYIASNVGAMVLKEALLKGLHDLN